MMLTMHLLIKGKVQGVFYRATARGVAEMLEITGWIKNTREGHVEALISGQPEKVKQFVTWCWQGPPNARVTDVQVEEKEEESFENFRVIR